MSGRRENCGCREKILWLLPAEIVARGRANSHILARTGVRPHAAQSLIVRSFHAIDAAN